MKPIIFLLLLITSNVMYSQNSLAFFNALKNKDTNTINKYLSSDIDLCIDDYQDYIDQSTAIAKIKQFLDKENPQSFEVLHSGKSKNANSLYSVAKFNCTSGIYRVFIYYEKSNNHMLISEIRFDK